MTAAYTWLVSSEGQQLLGTVLHLANKLKVWTLVIAPLT